VVTDRFKLAKTRKDVILQKFLDDDLNCLGSNINVGSPLVYYGRTTDATPTEIFIGGKLPITTTPAANGINRLYLPESSAVIFTAFALAYNFTGDSLGLASHYKGGVSNINTTTAAIKDYETTTGGTQAFFADPLFATVAVPLAQGLTFATGTNAVSFTADDTNDALVVTVTGTAAVVLNWKVYLHCYTISETSDRFYGDAAAGLGA
jgi:hypothetical protein